MRTLKFLRKATLFFLIFNLSTFIYADLGSFKNDVENAEKKDRKETKDANQNSDDNNPLASFILEIMRMVWLANNSEISYGSHPYCQNGFIRHPEISEDATTGEYVSKPTGDKNYWYSADIQAFHLSDIGSGSWFTFKGNAFRFIGPYIEGGFIADGHDVLNGLRAGVTFSLFQSNPLSMSVYGQWQTWSGVFDRNGGVMGIEANSYPIKPIALHFRAGMLMFEKFSLGETEVKAGIFASSFEIYGGYRWWKLLSTGGDTLNHYTGPFIGTAFYF